MALIPKLNFCLNNSCSELLVNETTGVINPTSNVGGYGSPNPTTAIVTSYSLIITDPNDVTYTIDLFASNFPTTDSTMEYSIPLSLLGNRTVIEDGFWQFSWTVASNVALEEFTAVGNSASYFTCNTECCVAALLAAIDVEEDDCNCNKEQSQKILDYLKAKAFLESLRNAAFCGKLTLFNNIKSILTKMCAKVDCTTCN